MVILGEIRASIEYSKENEGAAIITRITAGIYVHTFSNKVWCAKATRRVCLF
jgi:hypothetical protein